MSHLRWISLVQFFTAGIVAGSLSGCNRSESAPPVANVSVTLSKSRVPAGGPLEMTYRFEARPAATIPKDYRVFVHVLNKDRQPLWSDDHDPPQPTSSWKPGQAVEYTRFQFVPVIASPGEASVEVGLYSEDERLPLQNASPTKREMRAREYRVATLEVLPEHENVFLMYQSGWHPEEFSADDPPRSWKWTRKSALVSMKNPRRDSVFYLQYDGRPDLFSAKPQQVSVSVDDHLLQTFAVDSADVTLRRVPIAAAQLGSADTTQLRIDVDQTFVPAKLPAGGKDTRELGIRVYHAFVDSR